MKKRKAGEGHKPRLPEPELDSVDYAEKILYGSDRSRLLAVFRAKERRDASALPALVKALPSSDEVGIEAREALPVILEANPGDARVSALVPDLGARLSAGMDGYFAAWTLARICEANPKKFRDLGPKLMAVADEAISRSDGYLLEELAICFGQMGYGEAKGTLARGLEAMTMDLEVRMRIEKELGRLFRQALMH